MNSYPTYTTGVDRATRILSVAVYAVISVAFFIGWSLT